MQENDPPYLTVGTEVSAKYKGAFCEAKIRKVVRVVKCKVTFKSGLGSVLLSDDQIKGSLRVGANVEARHPDKNAYIEAVINKIQDCSQYTVVFDDGDITTLRRSALCLKSGRHFNESDTLDHLPLTHPEHFSNPVVGGRRNVRRRRDIDGEGDESGDEESLPPSTSKGKMLFNQDDSDVDIGKVVCVEVTDKKKGKDNWFPGVIVSPSAQETVKIRTKDEYLVRSFRDGRYYTVPKKEITSFSKDSHGLKNDANSNILKSAIEKAVQFIDKNELPAHWDKDVLFSAVDDPTEDIEDLEGSESEDSEEDSQAEEKDLFVAKLYKYMEERGTPINKVPVVCNRDLDLHKLYKVVIGRGGYNKVTNSSQWKSVTVKMGFGSMPSTSTINLVKQGYKKFIHNFEEFTRKLGCNFPVGNASTSSRSNRIMFRDRHTSSSSKDSKKEDSVKALPKEIQAAMKEGTPTSEAEETTSIPSVSSLPPVMDEELKRSEDPEEIPRRSRSRQESRQKIKEEELGEKDKGSPGQVKKRRGGAKEEKGVGLLQGEATPEPPPLSQTPPIVPASPSKRSSGRGKYKRKGEKDDAPEPLVVPEEYFPGRESIGKEVQVQIGDKLSVYYGKESEGKKYEAKVVDRNEKQDLFFVHYAGWNNRYDEWIPRHRVAENLSLRTEQVTSVPQGRGPGPSQSSASDGTVSDSGTLGGFKGPLSGKAVKKKLKPSALLTPPLNPTRTKGSITPRKRLSSEGDATATQRHTRKRALSGGEAADDSSESEGKTKSPKRIRKPKKIYDPGVGDWRKSVPSPDILDFSKDEIQKDVIVSPSRAPSNQVIDLNKLRSEMKGIDKMVKVPLSVPICSEKGGQDTVNSEIQGQSKILEINLNAEKGKDGGDHSSGSGETVGKTSTVDVTQTNTMELKDSALKEVKEIVTLEAVPPNENTEQKRSKITELEVGGTKLSLSEKPGEESESVVVPKPKQQVQAPSIEIIPAPAKVPKIGNEGTTVTRPPLPALLRATAPITSTPNIQPIRSSTPITISVPQRTQRPILIKCPTSSTPTNVVQPSVSAPQLELQNVKPISTASTVTSSAVEVKILTEKDPASALQLPPVSKVPSGKVPEKIEPSVTLITTTAPIRASVPQLKGQQVRPPKLVEGPKLASYPTARIRAVNTTGVMPGPSLAVPSTASAPLTLAAGTLGSGLKKRRKTKSQKFIESSDSSDEQVEAKRQKKHTHASKTSFKQVNLQVTGPQAKISTAASSTTALQGHSSAIGLRLPTFQSASIGIGKKSISASTKVTPIMKMQYGIANDKRSVSPGGKIVSGKYTRVEPTLKPFKKGLPPLPTLKAVLPIPQQPSVIVKKPLPAMTPLSIAPPLRPSVVQGQVPTNQGQDIKISDVTHASGQVLALTSSESDVLREEPFVPFKNSLLQSGISASSSALISTEASLVEKVSKSSTHQVKSVNEISQKEDEGECGGDLTKEKDAVVLDVPSSELEGPFPEEESCHSLLCEEEIPGSPTPGPESKSFLFDDSNAVEFTPQKMTLPVARAENLLNQNIFSAASMALDKPSASSQTSAMTKSTEIGGDPMTVVPPSVQEVGNFTQISAANRARNEGEAILEPFSGGEENPIENSPLPMSSSSSISTGSPREGDGEHHSASGENKSKEHSDTDSIDCLPKCGDLVDENSTTDDDERDVDHKYGGRSMGYEKSSGRSRSPSSSPRKRRMVRREFPDESPPRSYRGSHRSSIRRGLDADYGRMPPPQPPVNLGKPPHSEKYNFIPVLTDSMPSDERVDLCMSSLSALRDKWKELKTELSFYDRKKKRIRKRKRELEKREKEALLKASTAVN